MRHQEVVIDFQKIVQVVPCALAILNEEGRIVSVNAQTEILFGYGREELLHQSVLLLIADRCRTALTEYLAGCVSPPSPPPSFPPPEVVWYGRCKNGSDFPLALSLRPVDTADGVLVVSMMHDMTAHKQMEEELRQRALLIDLSYEPIFVWDWERGIVLWNRGCEQLYGFTKAAAMGCVSHRLLRTEFPESLGRYEATLLRHRQWSGELWHTTYDGRQVIVESRHQLVEAHGRRLVLETNRDITLRKQAEEVLQRAHNELEQRVQERTAALTRTNEVLRAEILARQRAERERQQLLARLVTIQEEERRRISRELHDQLGQDLHALMLGLKSLEGYGQHLLSTAPRIQQLQALTAQIEQAMHRLAWDLRPPDLDDEGVETVLQNYVEDWSQRFGIAVDFHSRGFTSQRLPSHLETVLYRIVQEAFTNVLKHAQAQRISVLLECRREYVLAIVEDDGIGCELDTLASVRQGQGRLGVTGMRERAALVDGTVEIESTPGAGTTVFVRLPILQTDDEHGSADASLPRQEASS
ncbi:MAG TPA: PAS domain S-box protein [Candidatus Tectomicrobia bacterium]|jgi:PAS domain S-box-containing protein